MLILGGTSKSPVLSINAPISGYVSDIYIKIGSNAETGKPMFTILDNSKMHVDLLIYEKDLLKSKLVRMSVLYLPIRIIKKSGVK